MLMFTCIFSMRAAIQIALIKWDETSASKEPPRGTALQTEDLRAHMLGVKAVIDSQDNFPTALGIKNDRAIHQYLKPDVAKPKPRLVC
jgi:hypothetical protein